MVKLASVRETRAYGPAGSKDIWEDINAFGYLIAALLLTAGSVLLLPGYNVTAGLWLILVGLVFILIVNLHDLYATLAGVDFRPALVTLDPQLALIEIAAPLVQAIGAIVYFVGAFLLLRVARGDYNESTRDSVTSHAYRLLIAGPAIWLLGSIHNSFQVYENTELEVQAYQRGVTLPFVIGSLLLLLSGVVNILSWPAVAFHTARILSLPGLHSELLVNILSWPAVAFHTARMLAATLAVAGAALLLVGGVVNAIRVIQLQQTQQTGGHVEKLRGGAQEALLRNREDEGTYAPVRKEDHYHEIESGHGNPYKKNVVPAARLSER